MSTVAAASVARPRGLTGRRARAGHGLVWAVLLGALGVSLAPGLYMVSLSFMDNPPSTPWSPPIRAFRSAA